MWEGVIEHGEPNGFARILTTSTSFIGYLHGRHTTKRGTGLFFKDSAAIPPVAALKYSGIYYDG